MGFGECIIFVIGMIWCKSIIAEKAVEKERQRVKDEANHGK